MGSFGGARLCRPHDEVQRVCGTDRRDMGGCARRHTNPGCHHRWRSATADHFPRRPLQGDAEALATRRSAGCWRQEDHRSHGRSFHLAEMVQMVATRYRGWV